MSHCREQFGDCALIEMIHLHDCFRGAIRTLQQDVRALAAAAAADDDDDVVAVVVVEDETKDQQQQLNLTVKKIASRFQVIWSVFQAHSTAEDEFIWPALLSKLEQQQRHDNDEAAGDDDNDDEDSKGMIHCCSATANPNSWREYEKDHVVLERMFSEMDQSLAQLRQHLGGKTEAAAAAAGNIESQFIIATNSLIKTIQERAEDLSRHLLDHLEKEETHCMPFIAKRLTKAEIQDLVGCIMGKRSADTVTKIMTMATQSLDEEERLDMLRYMKEAMEGTFFDRWLSMSGWMPSSTPHVETASSAAMKRESEDLEADKKDPKRFKTQQARVDYTQEGNSKKLLLGADQGPKELQGFIRAIATNPELTAAQKNMTIRGLEDSVRISCLKKEQQFS